MTRERDQRDDGSSKTALYVLLLFTAVMGALALYWGVQWEKALSTEKRSWLPQLLWAVGNCLMGAFAAFSVWMNKPTDVSGTKVAPNKLILLAVGGTLGLTTFLFMGLGYAYWNEDWQTLIGKGRAAWKEWRAWVPVAAGVGGLIVMFASLLTVRSEERDNPMLRRLIYGYNTFLTALLLLAILAICVMMVHFYGSPTYDWTASHIYSISDETKRILRELKTPVRLYVLYPAGNPTRTDLEMMLSSFKQQNPAMIDFESISPNSLTELPRIAQLQQEHGWTMDDSSERDGMAKGVLVVVEKEGDRSVSEFVRKSTMEEVQGGNPMGGGGDEGRVFKGEQAIMTSIVNQTGGKTNLTVYFTQGNGEPKLDDRTVTPGQDRGLAALKQRLEEKGYVVKELSLTAQTGETPKVPDDAFAVAVVGPKSMDESKVEALREYAKNPKGKLVVLIDVNRNDKWEFSPHGLEKFLGEFGIQSGKHVIFNAYSRRGLAAAHVNFAAGADRLFKDAFGNQDVFYFYEATSVRPAANNPASHFAVTPLLEATKPPDLPMGQWLEENPARFIALADAEKQEFVRQKRKENETQNATAFSVAVTVREKSEQPAADPHAFMKPDAQGAAKMVVFGDASFATNWMQAEGDLYFDLFYGSLGWLRERADAITTIKPKIRDSYSMKVSPEDNRQIQFIPGLVMLAAIVACGVGVLLMRKR